MKLWINILSTLKKIFPEENGNFHYDSNLNINSVVELDSGIPNVDNYEHLSVTSNIVKRKYLKKRKSLRISAKSLRHTSAILISPS